MHSYDRERHSLMERHHFWLFWRRPFRCPQQIPRQISSTTSPLSPPLLNFPQDKACTVPEKYLPISNSRCKVLTPEECDNKNGFSLAKNESTYIFITSTEETMQDFYNAFKSICILHHFHEEYKALKMIGKGSFAKVKTLFIIFQ